VALARLLVLPSNLILMDEPTNHLDLDSAERLVEALKEYGGTLLFVSHNRSFINQLATRIWDVRSGSIEEWTGNLDAYLYHQQQVANSSAEGSESAAAAGKAAAAKTKVESDGERRRREAQEREAKAAIQRPLKKKIEQVEAQIAALEVEKKTIEPQLADPALYNDFARSRPLMDRFSELEEKLQALYANWESLQETLSNS
jgi:ATP-binding cassette subfamily F protein 3